MTAQHEIRNDERERIRLGALIEAMLATGTKELVIGNQHKHAMASCELHVTRDPECGAVRYRLVRPVTIEGTFSVVGPEFT
jgi:hypothetical protein